MNNQMSPTSQPSSSSIAAAIPAARQAALFVVAALAAAALAQGCDASEDSSPAPDAADDSSTLDVADPDVTTPELPDPNDQGDGVNEADADVWEGSGPPPGHCCSASSAGYVDCGPFGTGPSLDACPPGYQCLGELNPYCYARQPGTCVAIPETCPEVGPEAAVVAECTDMLGNLPETYASECHARQAGYIWILRPASEM